LCQSQVYFRIGVPFEKVFLPKISRTLKNLNVVDTRKGVHLRYFRPSKGSQVPDPHIWLDPKQVKMQARTICDALTGLAPEHADKFEKNLQAFQSDLDNLDARLAKTLAPLKGQKIYVFHPAFGYFARSYGLIQVAVETEGKMPSPRQLSGLINKAREDNIRVIFVQPQFAKKDAETIARAIGGIVLPIDPLAGDYMKNLEYIADAIKNQGSGVRGHQTDRKGQES
ncbi:MAG: zinc ABC transporter substrate-binding protein, partial [Thermodesulfobacteriota bacterium]|nr:zinc ABC transporter substrate-binding protein [Thermodesulfobacteriota bacterium]